VVDAGAGQLVRVGLTAGPEPSAVVNRGSVLGQVGWLVPRARTGWDNLMSGSEVLRLFAALLVHSPVGLNPTTGADGSDDG
jgi:hypothetical protein